MTIPFQTTEAQRSRIPYLAAAMNKADLPVPFVERVRALAMDDQGAFDLMELWANATDANERGEIVADLDELLSDVEEAPARAERKPRVHPGDLAGALRSIRAFKDRLRVLIDQHGGVSAVARKAGIPQPSLSRMLASGSMPRRSTLFKIANAIGVAEREVVTEWVR